MEPIAPKTLMSESVHVCEADGWAADGANGGTPNRAEQGSVFYSTDPRVNSLLS